MKSSSRLRGHKGPAVSTFNKVSTAITLRFEIHNSSLPEEIKTALGQLKDNHISPDGVIIIKAQRHRSQIMNRQDALDRLKDIILKAIQPKKKRKSTVPSKSSVEKRLQTKKRRSITKLGRRKVDPEL